MQAMSALLHGPCFDEGLRKMSGRAVQWIRLLISAGSSAASSSASQGGLMPLLPPLPLPGKATRGGGGLALQHLLLSL